MLKKINKNNILFSPLPLDILSIQVLTEEDVRLVAVIFNQVVDTIERLQESTQTHLGASGGGVVNPAIVNTLISMHPHTISHADPYIGIVV